MDINLPKDTDVSILPRYNSTTIEIKNTIETKKALLEAVNSSDWLSDIDEVNKFFADHEDELQDYLTANGYIFNKA